jgi:hypothetical protein
VDYDFYKRPHCFVIEFAVPVRHTRLTCPHVEKDGLLGLMATSEAERDRWVDEIKYAAFDALVSRKTEHFLVGMRPRSIVKSRPPWQMALASWWQCVCSKARGNFRRSIAMPCSPKRKSEFAMPSAPKRRSDFAMPSSLEGSSDS